MPKFSKFETDPFYWQVSSPGMPAFLPATTLLTKEAPMGILTRDVNSIRIPAPEALRAEKIRKKKKPRPAE
jgi:hypothetical protein